MASKNFCEKLKKDVDKQNSLVYIKSTKHIGYICNKNKEAKQYGKQGN